MSDFDDEDYQSFEFETEDEDEYFDNKSQRSLDTSDTNDESVSPHHDHMEYVSWTQARFIQTHFLDKFNTLKESTLSGCTESDLLILLQYKRWQPEEVINDYFDNKSRLYERAGLPVPPLASKNTLSTKTNYTCSICCETYRNTGIYSLTCGHEFCVGCYHHYITNELPNGRLITCMIPDCKYTIPHLEIERIIEQVEHDKSLIKIMKPLNENRFLVASAKAMIDSSSVFKWCPAPDCRNFTELSSFSDGLEKDWESPKALGVSQISSKDELVNSLRRAMIEEKSIDLAQVPIVKCPDTHEFCFNCNFENHLPCPCWVVKKWVKKCQDDSETAHWIEANTTSCPKCLSSIEKNGGCNHMTCKKCQHEFCWICLGLWKEHNNYYNCNKFRVEEEEVDNKKVKSRLSLQRYLHFFKRFTIHENSMKGDRKILKQVERVAVLYLENRGKDESVKNLAWTDIQFLTDAIRALTNGRKTLKWTYCFVFYLRDTNFQAIFENNQDYLNKAVEDLSEIFEFITTTTAEESDIVKLIVKNKSKIINLSKTISLRQKTLIEGAGENLKDKLMVLEA